MECFHNYFEEKLERLDFASGTLLPTETLATLFPEVPVSGQLHVVVKVWSSVDEPDLTHPTEKGAFHFLAFKACV